MSDNKLVKSILDAATITGLVAGVGWIVKKNNQRKLHSWSQCKCCELRQVHSRHGRQYCPEEIP